MTAYKQFMIDGRPAANGLSVLDVLASVGDDTFALTPTAYSRKGNGSGNASFEADLVKADLTGRHLTATISVKTPTKGRYWDFRQMSVRPSTPDKTAQTAVKTLDGLSFDLWYAGKAVTVEANSKRDVVGLKRGNNVLKDVWESAFVIGNLPLTVTVTAAHVTYEVKTANGRDTFVPVEGKDKANPADTRKAEDASQPSEVTQDAEAVNA